jgi:hypothetical protein
MLSRLYPALLPLLALVLSPTPTAASDAQAPDAVRFVDVSNRLTMRVTALGRPRQPEGYGPAWLDVDGDRRLDLVFMNHGPPPALMQNDGRGGFIDRTGYSSIKLGDWDYPEQGDRHGLGCSDFNNDGWPDIHIAHGAMRGETLGVKRDELLVNRGGFRFDDVVPRAGTENANGRARIGLWTDFDSDGLVDLYAVNFQSRNVLYRNLGDGQFADVSARIGDGVDYNRAAWTDFDGDGDPDVLQVWPLQMLRNDGGERFVDVTADVGLRGIGVKLPFALAWRDFDNDGDPDVFVSARHSPGRLMVNEGGRFRAFDRALTWGHVEDDSKGNGAVWGDVDNDGWPDLVLTRSTGVALFMNQRGRGFEQVPFAENRGFDLGHGGEVALGDFDGDGYLDAAFNELGRNHLYRNVGGDRSWLAIQFDGRTANRMGFGARVRLEAEQADGSTLVLQRQYHGDNGSFRSVGCGPLHVGLGSADSADLTVRWPGGRVQRLDDVAVNRWIEVTEIVE